MFFRTAFAVPAVLLALVAWSGPDVVSAQTGLVAIGTSLTVTTSNAVATFNRGDLVGFQNTLTGEQYLRHPSTGQLAGVDAIASTGQPLQATDWTLGVEPGTGHPLATMSLGDGVRSLFMSVKIDPTTQEIVVGTAAVMTTPGLRGASWSLAGLDLQDGRLLVPARTGQVLDRSSPGIGERFEYPDVWNAQMAVYEGAAGSVVVYSTDQNFAFKRLQVSTRGHTTIDVAVGTDAAGPYASATTTPPVYWRLKAFQGDWQVAADTYRTWLAANRPPVSTASYPWVANIHAVVTVVPVDTSVLAPLANLLVPSETLLYLVQWRSDAYDVDYPDYTPAAGTAAFVAQAKALGFRVMLHTDLIGVSPTSPDYAGVQAFHARHPETLQLLGWRWEMPPSTPYRFAYINPAASAFRNLFIARVSAAVTALQPDALHLDISSAAFNDGNGTIEGRSYPAGSVKLHQELRAAFPTVALGGEGENDLLYPYQVFAQVLTYTEQAPPPGHAISAFLFAPAVQYYGHLGTPHPKQPIFKRWFVDTVTRGAVPALKVDGPSDLSLADPDTARLVTVLQTWQNHDFRLATGNWNGDLARWEGSGASTAALTDSGGLLTLTAAGSTVAQMLQQQNRVVTPRFSPGWPAFDATTLFGLDPAARYWLDTGPRPAATHATSVPLGVKAGPSTLSSSRFLHLAVDSAHAPSFDAVSAFVDSQAGVRFQSADTPLANGASVHLGSINAGGTSRSGLFMHPPYQGQIGGETYAEYSVPISPGALLRFGVGVADDAVCTDGVTFRVAVNGVEAWSANRTRTGWLDVTLSLAPYAGTTVALRFTSNPGPLGNANCDWSLWSGLHVDTAPTGQTVTLPVALAPGAIVAGFDGDGLATPGPSAVTVTNLPVPGKFTLFSAPPSPTTAGTSLLALPFEAWLAGRGEIARLGSIFGSGTLSSGSAGGVFKTPTVNAHPPYDGKTILTWTLQLPAAAPLRLGWAAGILNGGTTDDGVDFEVRVNGVGYWRLTSAANQWNVGSLDLAAWQGRPILVELVTDSRSNNSFDWAHWADVSLTAGGGCSYGVPGGVAVDAAGASGQSFTVTTAPGCAWAASTSASWISIAEPSAGVATSAVVFEAMPNWGAPRSGTIVVAGQAFTVTQGGGSNSAVQNGTFDLAASGWQMFATPNSSYISAAIVGGALEFWRVPPPAGTTNQATVFQTTGLAVPIGGGLDARFDLGNSGTDRKRISVLLVDADFSDLSVCTFWLAPASPMRSYAMRTHTTKAWTNAAIYFYAATAGSGGGAYVLDNVSVYPDAGLSSKRVECVDPTAPPAAAVPDGPTLVVNGDFSSGPGPWSTFGTIVSQIAGGVFEFVRPASTPPAGVVLQNTLQGLPATQVVTATFDLGNSSAVRKRVTVILHDSDFSDLAACTFWLPPSQALSPYTIGTFATKAWSAATVSVYPATVGPEPWIQLDNVAVQTTPSRAVTGTTCIEPGG